MNNKYDDFIITELGKLFKDKTVNNVMNCLNEYLNMEKMNKFIETKNMQEGKKEYENATKEKSGMDSIRGKLCEKIVKYAIECSLEEEHRNDIIIESRSKTISENFVMRSAQNLNLLKKFDVDLLLYNKQLQNKYYCLSIKNSTRERIGQSEAVLFMLDKEVMKIKYNSSEVLFSSPIWEKNAQVKYGMVIFDLDGSDYSRISKSGKAKKNVTREFDVELFFQDKKFGGGFTLLNNHKNFLNTNKYSTLIGKILEFFDEK